MESGLEQEHGEVHWHVDDNEVSKVSEVDKDWDISLCNQFRKSHTSFVFGNAVW